MKLLLPLVILVASTILSGCIDNSTALEPITRPALGDRYLYLATDGSRMEVLVHGVDVRHDNRVRVHEVLLIQYVLEIMKEDGKTAIIHSEEAIDLSEGLIVQQNTLCYERPPCEELEPSIIFGATGLPGGLGMGPFWATGGWSPDSKIDVHPEVYLVDHLKLDSRAIGDDSSCHSFSYTPDLPNLRYYHNTWTGPVTEAHVCPDVPLPIRFTPAFAAGSSADRPVPTFHLERVSDGTARVAFDGQSGIWTSPFDPFAMTDWSERSSFLYADQGAAFGFGLDEAHTQAQRLDSEYRSLSKDADSLLFSNGGGWTRGSRSGSLIPIGNYDQDVYEWQLTLDVPDRPPRLFVIEKVVEEREGETTVEYRMKDPDTQDKRRFRGFPDLVEAEMESTQVDVNEAFQTFHTLTGKRVNTAGLGPLRENREDPLVRTDGYVLSLYSVPDMSEAHEGGMMVVTPTGLRLDGPTGSILRISFSEEVDMFERLEKVRRSSTE